MLVSRPDGVRSAALALAPGSFGSSTASAQPETESAQPRSQLARCRMSSLLSERILHEPSWRMLCYHRRAVAKVACPKCQAVVGAAGVIALLARSAPTGAQPAPEPPAAAAAQPAAPASAPVAAASAPASEPAAAAAPPDAAPAVAAAPRE